ncbi:ankycorbin isoform X2 [Pygocentrus nattereri]|uniref:ankycorbin isoform X2 n=1 Tax=Pygocentrus nattereri TaxID=42514 RepID=UPI001891218E|nr:ankycorbin isoform X2 [Pygocentrus nattereri]
MDEGLLPPAVICLDLLDSAWKNMKSLKAKFRKSDAHEWSKNDERLLSAVEHGETEKVASLLSKKGANATKLDSEGKSALHVAATRGQAECLAVILAHGADVSLVDASGSSALHLAAKNNHQECAKKLIQSKCVVDALDGVGRTALHHAAASGSVVIVQLLCEHKCPVNLKDTDGFTSLLLSARHAHAEVCRSLLDWGADINACDKNGRTAVMLASESSCAPAVEVLVQRGADLLMVDSLGHDVLHYTKLSGSGEVRALITAALHRQQSEPDKSSSRTPQHDHVAKLNEERSTTPKKRKAPPPPISPVQLAGIVSPPYLTPTETPVSSKSDSSKRFNYKEEELRSVAMKEEIEKLQEEKSMLLETIEDLKQIVEQTEPKASTAQPFNIPSCGCRFDPQPLALSGTHLTTATTDHGQTEHCGNAESTLIATLQAKVASLSLENQQLAQIIKKRPAPQGEEGNEDSRPNSFDSNVSYHSTQADFDFSGDLHSQTGDEQELSEVSALDKNRLLEEAEHLKGGSEQEILLLRDALQSLQAKLQESRLENRSLQARLQPNSCAEEIGSEGMSESVAELKANLTDSQQKYQDVLEEVQTLRAERRAGAASQGEDHVVQKFQYLKGCLEQEVKDLKAKLAKSQEEKMRDASLIKDLEARLQGSSIAEDERQELKNSYDVLVENVNQEKSLLIEKYKEAQEEIKMLQEALRGTVPVEAAAKDFEEMKVELGEVIEGLQRRLLELSKSYSEAKSELSAARSQLQTKASESKERPDVVCFTKEQHEQKMQEQALKMKDVQNTLKDTEIKYQAALKEISQLKQDAEAQAQSSVSLADHTQVVASLGSAIKNLEAEIETLKQQLSQKTLQVDALQNRLTVEKDVTPDDSVSRLEHEQLRESLEGEVNHLTNLLQDALRKQDEMALEVTAAWQEVKDERNEKQAAQKLTLSREQENNALNSKHKEAQDIIVQLKKQVENHMSSEKEKNKKIDDLSKEVGKLKDALNSLSQLSYTTSTPKRQQNQQVDSLQQQIKQLQYQLAESKKQHHEIVSVYRMHLLYAVQGQMDEDVQKALKQILMMCKLPAEAK